MRQATALWALVISVSSCSGELDSDSRAGAEPLQGGKADTGHPAVGLVWFTGGGFCTGTLIAPDVVLTAGHCVADPVESFYTGMGSPTSTPETPPAGMIAHAVAEQVAHPSYAAGSCPNVTFDIGLIRLSAPLDGVTPMKFNQGGPPAIGTSCTAVGFGTHNEGATVTYEEKRTGSESVKSIADTAIQVEMGTALADHGDSGGPLICNSQIAGATSCHTDGDIPEHQLEYYARIDAAAAWIASTIQGWNGTTTTTTTTSCSHPVCDTGNKLVKSCDSCVTQICAGDSYCCDTKWDDQCVSEAGSVCGQSCGANTCAHSPCAAGGKLAKSCDSCVTQICATDSYCCDTKWDDQCVGEVDVICGQSC